MKNFKTIIYSFSVFAITLLFCRMYKNESPLYVFLIWNLFLAFIPLWISDYLIKQKQLGLIHLPIIALWLLFIPNSPYILTDLFHLGPRKGSPFWLDLVVVTSFALIGLMVFYRSLIDMIGLAKTKLNSFQMKFIIPITFWIIAFGLYLGRYLRFNSWDIVQHPFRLARRSFHELHHKDALAFSFIFSIFMWFVYLTLITFNSKEKQ